MLFRSPIPSVWPLPTPSPTLISFGSDGRILGDSGSVTQHHDFVVTKGGVASTFVWVPVFQAYQLINPSNCGYADEPVGVWVASQPTSGTRDVDWAVETFGGFYAGKYEASHADATPGDASSGWGATEGSLGTLKVAPYVVPWAVPLVVAKALCEEYDPACHLMTDDEWTALAVWSMIRDVMVYGNNYYGEDFDDSIITFLRDPTSIYWRRGLTGSGRRSGWEIGRAHV